MSTVPQVDSLFSENLFTYMRRYLDGCRGLVSAFQRLSPALQQIKSALNLDGDVRIGRQYRTLCRSVRHGAEQTLVVTDLLDGVQSMKQNRQRWERIDRELGAAIEGTSTVGQQYTYLRDFESELSVRMEGLLRAQDKLRMACQQIKEENKALKGRSTVSSTTGFWPNIIPGFIRGIRLGYILEYIHFGLVALILVLVSPYCSQFVYDRFGFPPYLTYSLIFLGGCCYCCCYCCCCKYLISKCLISKYLISISKYFNDLIRKYQLKQAKENEIFTEINNLVSEINDLGEISVRTVDRRSTLLPQVRVAVERFFKENTEHDHENIQKFRAELKFLIARL